MNRRARNLRLAVLLAGVLLATLGILALLPDDQGVESVATVQVVQQKSAELPVHAARPAREEATPRELPGEGALDTDVAVGEVEPAVMSPQGMLSGMLVDEGGQSVPNEPVVLIERDDVWGVHDPDEDDEWVVVARGVSDEAGRFTLSAYEHVTHRLVAGGNEWSRVVLEPVRHGDDVVVRMTEGHMLEGVVLERESGHAVPDAYVVAYAGTGILTRTDAQGRFRVGPVPAEDVTVGAWAAGFDVGVEEVAPVLGPVTLTLDPARTVTGIVLDGETTVAVTAGGEVTLTMPVHALLPGGDSLVPGTLPVHEVVGPIDEHGRFSLPGGVSRGFLLRATVPGYLPGEQDRYRDRSLGEGRDAVMWVRPDQPVTGVALLAESGLPAAGATAFPEAEGFRGEDVTTDSAGAFAAPLAGWDGAGRLYLSAHDAEGRSARARVRRPGEHLELLLVDPFVVEVLVTNDGKPVPGAEVAALSTGAEPTLARTDAQGLVTVEHRLAGPTEHVLLQARHGAQRSLMERVELEEWHVQPPEGPLELALDGGLALVGQVTDPFGVPVLSALVSLQRGPTAYTDATGAFLLKPVEPDVTRRLTVQADGYRSWREGIETSHGELFVELMPIVTWEIRVVDTASGAPTSDVIGRVQREIVDDEGQPRFRDTNLRLRRRSGLPGEFTVPLADAGNYRVRVTGRGWLDAVSNTVLFDGVNVPAFTTVMVSPAAMLAVRVRDVLGRPISGLAVTLVPWEIGADTEKPKGRMRKAGQSRRTDTDGRVEFNLGQGGAWRASLARGEWLDTNPIMVTPGPPVKREWVLRAVGNLELRVRTRAGKPLSGVRTHISSVKSSNDWSVSRRPTVRSPDGVLLVEALMPGSYDVTCKRRGYQSTSTRVVINDGQHALEHITMDEGTKSGGKPPVGGGAPSDSIPGAKKKDKKKRR